jgi:hypothetical protein
MGNLSRSDRQCGENRLPTVTLEAASVSPYPSMIGMPISSKNCRTSKLAAAPPEAIRLEEHRLEMSERKKNSKNELPT